MEAMAVVELSYKPVRYHREAEEGYCMSYKIRLLFHQCHPFVLYVEYHVLFFYGFGLVFFIYFVLLQQKKRGKAALKG